MYFVAHGSLLRAKYATDFSVAYHEFVFKLCFFVDLFPVVVLTVGFTGIFSVTGLSLCRK